MTAEGTTQTTDPGTDASPARAEPAVEVQAPQRSQTGAGMPTSHVLNVRLLLVSIAVVAVVAPALWFWHGRQVRHIGGALLAQAELRAEQSDWRASANYTHRYLQLQPEDAAARIRLAKHYDRSVAGAAGRDRAVNLYYQALGVAAEEGQQTELRRRLSELLLESGRFREAGQEAQRLIDADADDAEAHRVRALAAFWHHQASPAGGRHHDGPAIGQSLEQAVALNPQDLELASTWATVLREHSELLSDDQRDAMPTAAERRAAADAVQDRMVTANVDDPLAHLARFRYRTRHGVDGAEKDLQTALGLGSDRAEVVLAAAEHFAARATDAVSSGAPVTEVDWLYDQSIAHFRHLIDQLQPDAAAAYLGLGQLWLARDQRQEAVEVWRQGAERIGRPASATEAQLAAQLETQLATHLIAAGDLSEARKAMGRLDLAASVLRGRGNTRAQLVWNRSRDLLQAALLLKEQQPLEAIALARPISTSSQADPDQQHQALLLLGEAYVALADWDRAAGVYEQAAATTRGGRHQVRLAAGLARLQANQPALAARQLESALRSDQTGEAAVSLARAWFAQQIALPAAQRDWSRLDELLAQIANGDYRNKLAEPWRVEFLQADYILARGIERQKVADAAKQLGALLSQAEQVYADSAPFWQELTLRYHRLGRPGDTDRALERARLLNDQSATWHVIASGIQAARRQIEPARQVLHDALASLPEQEHRDLRKALANTLLVEGDVDAAREQLVRLQQDQPADLFVTRQLAELAIDARQWQDAERWEKQLRQAEGDDGTYWRYVRARRLLQQTEPIGSGRQEAARLHAELLQRRPSWPNTYILRGLLDELNGEPDRALDAYQNAMRLGDQRVQLYERAVSLLYRLGRFAEADEYLARLERQIPASESLSTLAISVATQLKDSPRAERLARQSVERRPDDPMAWIWYGQMLLLNEHPAEAEQAFRKAIELDPRDVRAWSGLFSFQLRTDQREQAGQTLRELGEQAELADDQRAFVLAQGFDVLGDAEQAEAKYREAIELAPRSVPVHAHWATFLLRHDDGQPDSRRTETALRQLLDLAARQPATQAIADNARRTLAALLTRRGTDGDFDEALRLLQQATVAQPPADLDQRLRAVLFAQRPNPDLDRAQQLLENLVFKRKSDADGDFLLLASVYRRQSERLTGDERQAKLDAARRQYATISERPEPHPTHLVIYIDFLLEQEQWSQAEQPLRRLEAIAPDDARSALLRAIWLERQGRSAEIVPRIEAFAQRLEQQAQDDPQRIQVCLSVGNIYTRCRLPAAAEPWYRKAVALDRKFYPLLADSLLAQGKASEAIELCLSEAQTANSAETATALANALLAAQADDPDMQRAEPLLLKALANHPNDPQLNFAVANVRAVQHRNDEAKQFYRQVLRLNPSDAVAMNNLATLLAETPGQSEEALRYVEQAIEISGPQPALLDTKGMILVQDGRAREAVDLLRQAADTPRADPRYHFHLAVALKHVGEADEARGALQTALKNDLRRQILTASDLQYLQELEQSLLQ